MYVHVDEDYLFDIPLVEARDGGPADYSDFGYIQQHSNQDSHLQHQLPAYTAPAYTAPPHTTLSPPPVQQLPQVGNYTHTHTHTRARALSTYSQVRAYDDSNNTNANASHDSRAQYRLKI
jgi:hypothetical protein